MSLSANPERQFGRIDFSRDLEVLESPSEAREELRQQVLFTHLERMAGLIGAETKPVNFSTALEQHIDHLRLLAGENEEGESFTDRPVKLSYEERMQAEDTRAAVFAEVRSRIDAAHSQPEQINRFAREVATLAQALVVPTGVGGGIPREENRVV